MILDGKLVAQNVLLDIECEMAEFFEKNPKNPLPTLAVVLVGNNPASLTYIKMKKKRAEEVGMNFYLEKLNENISQTELENTVEKLASQKHISGIIVQAPLPAHLDIRKVIEKIPPQKDVDGFSQTQIGNMFLQNEGLYSCTPKGIMTLLEYYKIDLIGKNAVVIGRSNIVGKPMALMLINAGATVTVCNSKTKNLTDFTKNADIIIVAVGKAEFLTKDMISPKALIIDVGSNMREDGSFCGDADFENLKDFVKAISPSPGGVGPMTVATLIANTWQAYKIQNNLTQYE